MILMKLGEEYKLYSHDSCIATTQESPHKRLSKQNCDEIFGVVDVEKLAKEYAKKADDISAKYSGKVFGDNNSTPFKDGFHKAMELNKDKLFTIEDIKRFVRWGIHQAYLEDIYDTTHLEKATVEICNQLIESIQQPTEIEVEIDMWFHGTRHEKGKWIERLDENDCLILKKK
jgi:hypothetical protein